MKIKFNLLLTFLLVFSIAAKAQDFTTAHDTIKDGTYGANTSTPALHNDITNNTSKIQFVSWNISYTNITGFTDWSLSICDNYSCYTQVAGTHITDTIHPGQTASFKLTAIFGSAPSNQVGQVVIALTTGTYSKNIVYILNDPTVGGIWDNLEKNKTLNLFPNPTADMFKVSMNGFASAEFIYIYNALGTKIKTIDIDPSTKVKELSIKDLPNGMYFVQVADSKKKVLSSKQLYKK